MKSTVSRVLSFLAGMGALGAVASTALADDPPRIEGDWIARDFRFHTGEVVAELRLHYITVGDPSGEKVLVLHGTTGSGASMLNANFAGELFGEGQALDARKYFIILPDALGAGKSTKPSDGLRAKFPRYNYDDMVLAQYRLLTEGLGVTHVRLVVGNSMGGMHTWLWGETWPGFMDALVPMASQPTEMSARNWMTRRILIESIRQDPAWRGGDYTTQPPSLRLASVFFGVATSGGTLGYQALAPTRYKADQLVEARLSAPPPGDANDFLYQFDAARDYNPAPLLERIQASVLAINSADDERNPPESGLMAQSLRRIRNGQLYVIPASPETRGHGTTGMAKFWKAQLRDFLTTVPRRAM